MRDPRLDKLAEVLVNFSTRVKKGELVTIVADLGAFPGVEAVYEAVLRAGAYPSFHPHSSVFIESLLRLGNDDQLRHVSPFEVHRLAHCDVYIVLMCPTNTRRLGKLDPDKSAVNQAARRELMKSTMARTAAGTLRWVGSEIPGNAAAQDADRSLHDYEDFVYRACFLHLPDPVAAWQALHDQQQRACDYLAKRNTVRFRSPARKGHEGTDLTVTVGGNPWINCSGQQNFPDGEVFSGPRDAEGVVNFDWPAVYRGRAVEGIRLKFKGGRVVEASAQRNEDYLISLLDQDAGARAMGEIAIGTNYHITEFIRNTLFDEKIGGSFHLAVGAGIPESGNTNESGLHWDIVCDLREGGTIHADGELIQENGRFVREGWPGRSGG